jgi:exodeoxyribonuclease V gamma subunit
MNDGDYPRSQPVHSFDLMSQRGQYRPGDRSRRQDDQYLFLEALLSARQQLYISWVGRNIRDNSERPPSVLISQLRDTLALGWQLADNEPPLLKALTVEHPLQPFSPEYVAKNRDSRLFTYAREWFEPSDSVSLPGPTTVTAYEKAFTLSLESLARFLKAPVKTFCNNTLKFGFDDETITSEDNEPFGFNNLESYVLRKNLLDALQSETPDNTDTFLEQQRTTMARQGKLPLGGFAHAAYADIADPVNQAWQRYQALLVLWPTEISAHVIDLSFALPNDITVQLNGELINLRQNSDLLSNGLIHLTAQALLANTGKIKYPNLLSYWVQHLAGCAAGMNLQTVVMGSDSVIEIALIEQKEAFEQLKILVEAWHLGMQAPLPVACKTAFAWLDAPPDKALDAAKSAYQGDDWTKGEVAYDAYLARFFPTFASLNQAAIQGNFETWADTLYRTAFTQINEQTAQDAQS